MSTRADIARWERISRGFDGPGGTWLYDDGLCRAFKRSDRNGDICPDIIRPFLKESGEFLYLAVGWDAAGWDKESRSIRATIAALIAAMIATGDA